MEKGLARGSCGSGAIRLELRSRNSLSRKVWRREALGALVVREEVDEFVAEDGDAAGFETDDGDSGFDLGVEFVEDVEQQGFGAVEHAEVVEGASAAEIGLRDDDAESGGFEDLDGGAGGRGRK